jgi:hypothetical protein
MAWILVKRHSSGLQGLRCYFTIKTGCSTSAKKYFVSERDKIFDIFVTLPQHQMTQLLSSFRKSYLPKTCR